MKTTLVPPMRRKKAKTNCPTILFPGRFQPFHNGHYHILSGLLKRFDVIVVIGSADLKNEGNLFSAQERKKMIEACFPQTKKTNRQKPGRLAFAAIPFAPDATWVKTLLKAVPRRRFNLVFTNNPRVQKQLRNAAIPHISGPMLRRNRLEGRRIRQWPKSWKKDVPKTVAAAIQFKAKTSRR